MGLSSREYGYVSRLSKKIKSINYKGKKCIKCSKNNIFFLEFHHKNSKEKDVDINILLNRLSRWSDLKKELDKCELVCRNCHKEIHYGSGGRVMALKMKLMEYKNVTCCQDCGYIGDNLGSLDFHHSDPKTKKFRIMKELNRRKNILDYIVYEVEKCEIICSNCHVKRHANIERYEQHKKNNI